VGLALPYEDNREPAAALAAAAAGAVGRMRGSGIHERSIGAGGKKRGGPGPGPLPYPLPAVHRRELPTLLQETDTFQQIPDI
jgi:hypothetical protein